MAPEISEYDLGEGRVQAFAYHDGQTVHMAVQPYLSSSARRSREIEAHGYDIRPPRTGQKFCLWPTSVEDIDYVSVKAQQRRIEDLEPEWIERVRRQWETFRDFTSTVFWTELEPETVMAILLLLRKRGEVAADGEWN